MRKVFPLILFTLAFVCATAYAQQPSLPAQNTIPWTPQPGEIILFRSSNQAQRFINGVGTGGDITHSGLVVMGKDGKTLQIVHALGNNDGISYKFNPGAEFGVVIEPLMAALYKERDVYKQELFLRPRKDPLTPEMSKALTEFAYRQKGKPYSSPKVAGPLLVGPFKNRPLITEPGSYMCSELVCTALVAVGALPATVNPPAITPYDLYNPERLNIPQWKPKLDPKTGKPIIFANQVMYEPDMIPLLDKYGKQQNDIWGNLQWQRRQRNPVEENWKEPKPIALPAPKITPIPDILPDTRRP